MHTSLYTVFSTQAFKEIKPSSPHQGAMCHFTSCKMSTEGWIRVRKLPFKPNHSKRLPYFKDLIHGFQSQGSTLVILLSQAKISPRWERSDKASTWLIMIKKTTPWKSSYISIANTLCVKEDCPNKVHLGEIKAPAAGMGEKMLEGKTLQQVRPEPQRDIAGKHKHLISSACLVYWQL